jgi:hypothetical protein
MLIKFTHPTSWHSGVQGLKSNYLQHTPGCSGQWKDSIYAINDHLDKCDIWVVQGDLDKKETVQCKGPTVFIISEEVEMKRWNDKFLQQFDMVLGSQEGIVHPDYRRGQYVCPWQINKGYDELSAMGKPEKTEVLSAIVSDSTYLDGHKKRFAFVNQLKGHFKDRLHWFGRGNLFVEDKWDGLAPYRYSIAIENSVHPHYWTEKIADCFLSYAIPLYYGCSNISDYFPNGSYIPIDVNDMPGSVQRIEEAIASNWYENNMAALKEARRLILEEYQFFPWINKQVSKMPASAIPVKKTLYPEKYFIPKQGISHYIKRAVEIIKEH